MLIEIARARKTKINRKMAKLSFVSSEKSLEFVLAGVTDLRWDAIVY